MSFMNFNPHRLLLR